jgi:hypothetical protein
MTASPGVDLHEEIRLLIDVKSYHYKSKNGKSYCPVVRRTNRQPGGFPECGFVVGMNGLMEPTVYLGSLFEHFDAKLEKKEDTGMSVTFVMQSNRDVPDFPLPTQRLTYSSTLEMVEAGWEVD